MFDAIKKFLATRGVQIVARWVGMLFAIPAVVALLKKLGVDLSPEQIMAFAGVAGTAVIGAVLIGIDHFSHAQQKADEAVKKAMDKAQSYGGNGTKPPTVTLLLCGAILLPLLSGCMKPSAHIEGIYNPVSGETEFSVVVDIVGKEKRVAGTFKTREEAEIYKAQILRNINSIGTSVHIQCAGEDVSKAVKTIHAEKGL